MTKICPCLKLHGDRTCREGWMILASKAAELLLEHNYASEAWPGGGAICIDCGEDEGQPHDGCELKTLVNEIKTRLPGGVLR